MEKIISFPYLSYIIPYLSFIYLFVQNGSLNCYELTNCVSNIIGSYCRCASVSVNLTIYCVQYLTENGQKVQYNKKTLLKSTIFVSNQIFVTSTISKNLFRSYHFAFYCKSSENAIYFCFDDINYLQFTLYLYCLFSIMKSIYMVYMGNNAFILSFICNAVDYAFSFTANINYFLLIHIPLEKQCRISMQLIFNVSSP